MEKENNTNESDFGENEMPDLNFLLNGFWNKKLFCYFAKWTSSGLQIIFDRFDPGWRNNFLRKRSGGC